MECIDVCLHRGTDQTLHAARLLQLEVELNSSSGHLETRGNTSAQGSVNALSVASRSGALDTVVAILSLAESRGIEVADPLHFWRRQPAEKVKS